MSNYLGKKIFAVCAMSVAMSAFSVHAVAAGMTSADDPGCTKMTESLNKTAEQRLEKAKESQKQTTVDTDTFMKTLDDCISGVGGVWDNGYGMPGNPFDGLLDKLCKKGLEVVTAQNPITKAVNGFSVSDPTGLFKYDPSFKMSTHGTGGIVIDNTPKTNDTSSQVWGSINKNLPNGSDIWR